MSEDLTARCREALLKACIAYSDKGRWISTDDAAAALARALMASLHTVLNDEVRMMRIDAALAAIPERTQK